jgi:ATP-dependent Clp protease ATP-binding subunit ClpA
MTFITDKLKDLNKQADVSVEPPAASTESPGIVTRFRFDVNEVMKQVRSKIFGQDEVLIRLEEMLRIIWSDITEPHRPLCVCLFLGPTGVGKTELTRVLAEAIYGSPEAFCRIDMNTLSQEHYAAALTGAPPGYVGSKEGSSLFDAQQIEGSYSKPGIVLFDELEKASDQAINSLLNVMDNGVMVMTSGDKRVNFRNAMIFMTSNLGAEEIMAFADDSLKVFFKRFAWSVRPDHWGKSSHDLLGAIVQNKLEKRFSPEFINRFDDVFVFNWLENKGLGQILETLLSSLNRRIAKYGCEIELEDSAKVFLLKNGFNRKYGARFLKRTVRKYVEAPLAAQLGNSLQRDERIRYQLKLEGTDLIWKKEMQGEANSTASPIFETE